MVNYRFPTRKDYSQRDLFSECAYLHYGEKLAITLYTSHVFTAIQEFLRKNGKTANFVGRVCSKTNLMLTELLLGISVASHGLKKPSLSQISRHQDILQSTRFESVVFTSDYIQERKDAQNKKTNKGVLIHKGFTSSAHSNHDGENIYVPGKINCKTQIAQENALNPLGKRVEVLSAWEDENEILFPPKTQFHYTDFTFKKDMLEFKCHPVRTIENHDPFAYATTIQDHELQVIDEMLKNFYKSSRHSCFRRFFDTVSNFAKRQYVKNVSDAIQALNIKMEDKDSLDKLKTLQAAIKQAQQDNATLVKNAKLKASLGRTGTVLSAALKRVNSLIITKEKLLRTASDLPENFEEKIKFPAEINPCKVLSAMKARLGELGEIRLNLDVDNKIKALQKICNAKYYNQSFYGGAALNRMMLLDKEIADLLDPS
ncbi:MAG: hypothetical protein ACYCQI_13790, partial [Gammaproteobacteria bacterium]